MIRAEAVALTLDLLAPSDIVVAADGAIAREAYRAHDRLRTFYMLGSMGQVASIALGLAMTRSERVVALDGDGNLLMGFGGLAMVAGLGPGRFYHLVLDNACYATTGGQPCLSREVDLAAAAAGVGYATSHACRDPEIARQAMQQWLAAPSPSLLNLRVEPQDPDPAPRIPMPPEEMASRFRTSLTSGERSGG